MRVLFLAAAICLLASCATEQEKYAQRVEIYAHCVADAKQADIDPSKKCGTSVSNHEVTWRERYDYFERLKPYQQQAQASQPVDPREAYARACYSAALAAPSKTGFFESQANANLAYQQCLQGQSPTLPQQPKQTTCMPNGIGGFTCTSQ